MEYTGQGQGTLNTVLGAAGSGLGILGTVLATRAAHANYDPVEYATAKDLNMSQILSQKESEIALLKADQASEIKMTEVYRQAHNEIAALRDKVDANYKEQLAVNAAQAVVNAQVASNLAIDQNNIAAIQAKLGELTKTVIPITNVCPQPMPLLNSWEAPA